MGTTCLMSEAQAKYFLYIIGVFCWAVELGWIVIHAQVAMLSSNLAHSCHGHLQAVFHLFAHLYKYRRSKLVFHDTCVNWRNKFQGVDWRDVYPDISEPIPPDVPEPCV